MGRLAVFLLFPPSRSRFPGCRHCPASSRLSRHSPPFPSLINTSQPIGRVPVRPISSLSSQSSLFQVRLRLPYSRYAFACFIPGTPTPALFRYAYALFQVQLRLLYSRYAYACFIPGTLRPALVQVSLRLLQYIPGTPMPFLFSKVVLESYAAKKIGFMCLQKRNCTASVHSEPYVEKLLNLLVKLAYIFRLPWTAFSLSPRSEQLPVRYS
jgi:hypothetical protein